MKNILVPCDFSKPAEEAFRFAIDIAKQTGGMVHVLNVIDITFIHGNPTLSHAYAFNTSFLDVMEKDSYDQFKAMWERYAPMTMNVKFRYIISSLLPEIQKYIQENTIDLVIMGTHGQGNASFGSNTDKVIRRSPVPVLSVRTCPKQINHIVLPVMDTEIDQDFATALKQVQSFFHARLHILYVNTPLLFRSSDVAMKGLEQLAANMFTEYSLYVRSDYTVETGIAHFAKEIHADMVAMGTHAWKGLAHFLMGSVSEDVVNHLTMPIWTFHIK